MSPSSVATAVALSCLIVVAPPRAVADDGTWAFPVGSAESGGGWFVTIGLGDSWTSSNGTPWRGHLAEDWFLSSGSSLGQPVYAAAAGEVVVVRNNCGSYVDVVVIEHVVGGELIYSLYGHLEADGYVAVGDVVQKRQQIGVVGQPVVFVPHLHFSVFNRTAFVEGPHSNCTLPNGRYVASGYSGISNDYDDAFDFYDPSNDGIADNRFYHPSRFITDHQSPVLVSDNVARGAINWLASSIYNSDFGGADVYDGVVSSASKWVSDGTSAESWVAIDLGGLYDLEGIVVRHAGAGGEPAYVNTRAYRIETGDSLTGPWSTLATVDNASALDVTTTVLTSDVSARYLRLYITDAGVDDYARIPELEVYGSATAPPPPPPPFGDNVALGSVAWAASSTFGAGSSGDRAYDGVISAESKWTSDGTSAESWLALDLGAHYAIDSFVVRHAGAGGEQSYYNTTAFRLELGTSLAGPWSPLPNVVNEEGQDFSFVGLGSPQSSRYVRLYVTDAGIDDYARIPELEVYGVLVATEASLISNGGFDEGSDGLAGWSVWNERGNVNATATGGELTLSSANHNGGVYQQFATGGSGSTIDVDGWWESRPTLASSQWAEVLIINGPRLPVDGHDVSEADEDVVLIYKNDTWASPGGWSGAMAQMSAVVNTGRFVAAGATATILLKSGNIGAGGVSGVGVDGVRVHR